MKSPDHNRVSQWTAVALTVLLVLTQAGRAVGQSPVQTASDASAAVRPPPALPLAPPPTRAAATDPVLLIIGGVLGAGAGLLAVG
jgi:hypothetical protein